MPDPHSDAVVVEHLAEVMRVDPVHDERHGPAPIQGVPGSDDPQARQGLKPRQRLSREFGLVVLYGIHPQRLQVVHRRMQADRLGDHGDAGFEALRRVREGAALHRDRVDHGAAADERRHRRQDVGPAPQTADPGGTEHLVPTPRDEVDAQLSYVDRHVRHRLAGIQQDQRPDLACPRSEDRDGIDRAQDVALVHETQQAGALVDQLVQIAQVQAAIVGQADPTQDHTRLVAQFLPGHEIGVMLHLGDDDLVTLSQHEPIRTGGQVLAALRLQGGIQERVRH